MSDDMKLAKVILGPEWIDLSYGEPRVVLDTLHKHVNIKMPKRNDLLKWEYQPAQGYPQLVKLLEEKYKAKVVITNGAKQGMSACFYALRKLNHNSIAIHTPHWVSTPGLIRDQGLEVDWVNQQVGRTTAAMMLTSPNNPDGKELTKEQLLDMAALAKQDGITLLHDAAYYTPIYSSTPNDLINFGDAQIYSFSKMFGVSGIRIGYVVCHNEALFPHVVEYVERTTAGVSIASQQVALEIERFFLNNPEALKKFEEESRAKIKASREAFAKVNPEVLELDSGFTSSSSMFAWCKAGPKLNNQQAKVHFLNGSIFGDATRVRINIAFPTETIEEAVKRLNST